MQKVRLPVQNAVNLPAGMTNMNDCDICYKIVCKGCGWTASPRDLLLIQTGRMKECPDCGWMPGDIVENEAELI